jgi:hypothetical protein
MKSQMTVEIGSNKGFELNEEIFKYLHQVIQPFLFFNSELSAPIIFVPPTVNDLKRKKTTSRKRAKKLQYFSFLKKFFVDAMLL